MCVIICVEKGKFPNKQTLKDAQSINSHGGSIAWLNKDGTKSYKKNIKANEIYKIINNELIPNHITTAIIHFRIASVGGVTPSLCHPFEITSNVNLNMERYNINADLLFHNGTWSEYEHELIRYIKTKTNVTIPKGLYSDSRIMAYLAKKIGIDELFKLLKNTGDKVAILTSTGIIKHGVNWCMVDDVSCSNNHFKGGKFEYDWSKFDSVYKNYNDETWFKDDKTKNKWTTSPSKNAIAFDSSNTYDTDSKNGMAIYDELVNDYGVSTSSIDLYLDYGYSLEEIKQLTEEDMRFDRATNNNRVWEDYSE